MYATCSAVVSADVCVTRYPTFSISPQVWLLCCRVTHASAYTLEGNGRLGRGVMDAELSAQGSSGQCGAADTETRHVQQLKLPGCKSKMPVALLHLRAAGLTGCNVLSGALGVCLWGTRLALLVQLLRS